MCRRIFAAKLPRGMLPTQMLSWLYHRSSVGGRGTGEANSTVPWPAKTPLASAHVMRVIAACGPQGRGTAGRGQRMEEWWEGTKRQFRRRQKYRLGRIFGIVIVIIFTGSNGESHWDHI